MDISVKTNKLTELRAHIARIEAGGGDRRIVAVNADGFSASSTVDVARNCAARPTTGMPPGALTLGLAEIDRRLPGHGLQFGRLHEVVGAIDGAATGFAVHLLRRLQDRFGDGGPLFWCAPVGGLYAPGLACRGVDVDRLIAVIAPRRTDRLWAMEECLRCPGVLAVVGELRGRETIDLTASRRLQLAAGQGGAMALLLRPPGRSQARPGADPAADDPARDVLGASAATTRWHVQAVPGGDANDGGSAGDMGRRPRWRLTLTRSRTGARHGWIVEVDHATGDFSLAAPLRDRSGQARGTRAVA